MARKPIVKEEATVEAGSRVDVDHEDVVDMGLEGEDKRPAMLELKKMGDTVGLDGEEAFEVEEAVKGDKWGHGGKRRGGRRY